MSFFKKENIHNSMWALIIAFISFIGGLIWNNYSGPERVIIEKDNSRPLMDTTITIVRFEGDSSTIAALKNYNPQLTVNSFTENDKVNYVSIAQQRIKFPKVVKGYIQKSLNAYAIVEIARFTYSKGELIELELKLFDKKLLKKISPVFIEVVRKTSEKSVTQIWEEQFKINHMNNTIRFSSDFPKGKYQLTIGFYLMDEIHQKYPPFYSKRMKLEII